MSLILWSQKKKMKKITVADKVYTNLTPIVQLPEPPALDIHYNVDNLYDITHSKSDVENNETLLEDEPSTSSLNLEDLPDQNDNLIIGALEQSTNNNLFDYLTESTSSSYHCLEENFIGDENENISVPPFQQDVEKKSTSNGTQIFV